jgi:YVTN family beta-propeller protein
MKHSFNRSKQSYLYSINQLVAKLLIVTMLTMSFPTSFQSANAETIPESWVSIPVQADPLLENLTIPKNAASKGMWSSVKNWPLNALHAAVLPDGKVLSYGSPTGEPNTQIGRTFDIWNPTLGFDANSHTTTERPQQQNSFCSTAAFLSNGSLLISGGTDSKTSTIFNPSTNSTEASSFDLSANRWYSTMITLTDGRPLMLGGMYPYTEEMSYNPDQAIAQGHPSMTPEVYESTGWRTLFGAYSRDAFGPDYLRTSIPHAWVAPNGLVFGVSSDKMWYLDPDGNGRNGEITYIADYKTPYSADNPVNAGTTSASVMYAPGKILIAGGNGAWVDDGLPASNKATVIDINGDTPTITEQNPMTYPRRFANAVVLADGKVVILGGSKFGNANGSNAVYAAETWNPTNGLWTLGAEAAVFRGYHSTAALLTNGTILSAGADTLSAEIYYPPNLFESVNGASILASRPVIKAINQRSFAHDASLKLDMGTTQHVNQLVLVGLSMTTHAFNTTQRRVPLSFTQTSNRLTTTIPNANLTPPGYYQLIALNAKGVPSLGVIIAIGQGVSAPSDPVEPYTPPALPSEINAPLINAGGTAQFSVNAETGTTYSWNFGDGSASTEFSASSQISHTYENPGVYVITLTALSATGAFTTRTFLQAVTTSKTSNSPSNSTPITLETRTNQTARIWVVNPDNDSVSVIDSATKKLLSTINVGQSPRSVAIATDGRIWVTNKDSSTISIISPSSLAIVQTITLTRASQPHGLVFSPTSGEAFVVLEATESLVKLNQTTGAQIGITPLGSHPRHLAINADGTQVLVSRFITKPLPGESTAVVNTENTGAEVLVINPTSMAISKTIILAHSDKVDGATQGSGIPNYLAAPVISPDGGSAWVASKQDNIKRGVLRNQQNLDFQNTVRAIASNLNLNTLTEQYEKRIDFDDSSVGSAAVFHPSGVYLFLTLETSRQIAVVDAVRGSELLRVDVGRAPQGLAISADGNTLYVQEFMDRSVGFIDLKPLTTKGLLNLAETHITFTVNTEKLPAQVVLGKQFFYDAKDARLAMNGYMSCATCHNDGGHDGRVWDLTGFGEGLRNTISLKGRAGVNHGFLHWSANFDEVQDFEKQIRDLAGGLGLMTDSQFNSGTRNQPLGDKKAGVSTDLDELAAYVNSLSTFAKSPYRTNTGELTAGATLGKAVFNAQCIRCHGGNAFTQSADGNTLENIGTIKASSGSRSNDVLLGVDIPTLRDVWNTAPYLHDGSAATLEDAVKSHKNLNLSTDDLTNVVAYLKQIGSEETGNTPMNTLPTVKITTPASNITLYQGEQYNITATASDSDGKITKVEMLFNGENLLATLTNAPYAISGSTAGVATGAYSITARAYDDKGGVTTSAPVVITISPPDTNNTPPSAAITTPTSNVTLYQGEPYNISATASDTDGTITKVEILFNGENLLATLTNAPYAISGSTAGVATGAYSITARAYDNKGGVTTSAPVVITISAPDPNNKAPTVNITTPNSDISLKQGETFTLTVNATDSDGTVSRVELYDNETLLFNTLTTAPYSVNLSTAGVSLGNHSITAKAYDNGGAVSTSVPVVITITAN